MSQLHAIPMVTLGCFPHAAWRAHCFRFRLTSGCKRPIQTFVSVTNTNTSLQEGVCSRFTDRKLILLSAAHKPFGFFSLLVESAVRHGLHVHVLGWDTTDDFLHSGKDYKEANHYFGYASYKHAH
jgi:hypothetical protein